MKFNVRMLDHELRESCSKGTAPRGVEFAKSGEIDLVLKPGTLLSDSAANQDVLTKVDARKHGWSGVPVGVCTFRNVHVLRGVIFDAGSRTVWKGGHLNLSGAFNVNMASIAGTERDNEGWSIDPDVLSSGLTRKHGVLIGGPGFGNYGHWLVDYIPRLNRAAEAGLDAAAIVHQGAPSWGQAFVRLVLGAALPETGVPVYEAVHYETLTVPTAIRAAGTIEENFARATWHRLGNLLASLEQPSGTMPGERIFVSRRRWNTRKDNRVLRNAEAVEAAFVKAGFAIVCPETLSLAQQRHVFAQARVVAGEDGSGLHNTIYCKPGARVGVISMGRINSLHLVIANILGLGVTYCSAEAEPDSAPGYVLPLRTVDRLISELTGTREAVSARCSMPMTAAAEVQSGPDPVTVNKTAPAQSHTDPANWRAQLASDHPEQVMTEKPQGVLGRLNAQAKCGAVLLGPEPDPAESDYTVVVFGTPRGGTTMVAGVVQKLGIDLGGGTRFNLEDPAFDRQPVEAMLKTIDARNAERPVWGWKYPAAARYLGDLTGRLRNPRFIIVWRDPFTAALRSIEGLGDKDLTPQQHLRRSLRSIQNMMELQLLNLEAVRSTGCPSLMISYEKTVRRPDDVIRKIASFIGRPVPADLSELRAFMAPESYK